MTDQAQSFLPLVGENAHTLILGTMPGQKSLEQQQYYAHKRNAFWPIMMGFLSGQPPSFDEAASMEYSDRCKLLLDSGYAVWDVLASCERQGSLDSNIVKGSEIANDIAGLAQRHPELALIICNGRTAEKLFKRHIQASLGEYFSSEDQIRIDRTDRDIYVCSLPSTSPAMASLSLTEKYQQWSAAFSADPPINTQ